MKIILTAFSSFGGLTTNSSEEVLNNLPSQYQKVVLPVSYHRASQIIEELILSNQPDLLICLGQAGSSVKIRLEQGAYNEANASLPDEDHITLTHQPLIIQGEPLLQTHLPLKEWSYDLARQGFPVEISSDPGRYVCNATYYRALSITSNVIFIHLPYYEGQVQQVPTLPLANMVATVEAILDIVKHHPC